MISPWVGAAFSDATDGDLRGDEEARGRAATALGLNRRWASVSQAHGAVVVEADRPGLQDDADALFTRSRGLPLAVFGADCVLVVLGGGGAVGVAHAGWRGMSEGIVWELRGAMSQAGGSPTWGAIGPAIGPCCFEVGSEVAARFPGKVTTTTWGTASVDLIGAARRQLTDLEVWSLDLCTRHHPNFFSHRRDATPCRQAAIGWLP